MSFRFRTLVLWLVVLLACPLAARARGGCADFRLSGRPAAWHGRTAAPVKGSGAHGLHLDSLDRSVSPCQDFFEFADGGWIRSHAIPPGKTSWGLLDQLRARNQEILWQILEQEEAGRARAKPGSAAWKLGLFYAGCMDSRAIDAAGWKPLAPEFSRIARLRNLGELTREVARLQELGAGPLFRFGVEPDPTNSAQMIARVNWGGLGLPSREDYLQEDAGFAQLREKYILHLRRMFHLLGDRPGRARAEAKIVLRIETSLARAAEKPTAGGDPEAAGHKMSLRQLAALTPHFSWKIYLQALGLDASDPIEVTRPRFFRAMDRELASVPLADWKIYLRWQLIHAAAPDLSRPFVDENFDFYGRTLAGASRNQPRWQHCVEATDRALREPLGRRYTRESLSPRTREAALVMAHSLVAALRRDLANLYWMGPATRAAALAKLDNMKIEVGYPDQWPKGPDFRVTTGPFILNRLRGQKARFRFDLARIGHPVDRSRWLIPVSSVDPIYDPSVNAIFLPAGILQAPVFDPRADEALDYGGLGAIVGHEMTHAFDKQGSRFDASGNLRNWWTAEDRESFQQIADCVADQYSTYVAVDDVHENGHLVLAESMADIGGLTLAYQAFEKTAEYRSRRKIQGFTPRQRFFLAYARVWAGKEDPQSILLMVHVNPHALARYRVIGPLSDFEPFARAFRCQNGDAMYRPLPDRCTIW